MSDQKQHQNLFTAVHEIIAAINGIARDHELDTAEVETAIAKTLLMAIASHAKAGREANALDVIVDYLRQGLPIAVSEVAVNRFPAQRPAGHA